MKINSSNLKATAILLCLIGVGCGGSTSDIPTTTASENVNDTAQHDVTQVSESVADEEVEEVEEVDEVGEVEEVDEIDEVEEIDEVSEIDEVDEVSEVDGEADAPNIVVDVPQDTSEEEVGHLEPNVPVPSYTGKTSPSEVSSADQGILSGAAMAAAKQAVGAYEQILPGASVSKLKHLTIEMLADAQFPLVRESSNECAGGGAQHLSVYLTQGSENPSVSESGYASLQLSDCYESGSSINGDLLLEWSQIEPTVGFVNYSVKFNLVVNEGGVARRYNGKLDCFEGEGSCRYSEDFSSLAGTYRIENVVVKKHENNYDLSMRVYDAIEGAIDIAASGISLTSDHKNIRTGDIEVYEASIQTSSLVLNCEPNEKLVNPCRPWLGAWANHYPEVVGIRQQIEDHEARISRKVDIVHTYNNCGKTPLSDTEKYFINRENTILLVNWKPACPWIDGGGSNILINAEIDKAARSIKAMSPKKIMLNVYHEPENDVSKDNCTANAKDANQGSPSEYRAMWRNVRNRFDAQGVTNVVWVMNYMGYSGWECLIKPLYPGNDLVDWIMWDPYGNNNSDAFAPKIRYFYNWLFFNSDEQHNFKSKIWGLGEWGIGKNADQASTYRFYEQAKGIVETNGFPRIKAYVVFDAAGVHNTRISYSVAGDYDPLEELYYRRFANSAAFKNPQSALRITIPDADQYVVTRSGESKIFEQ